MAEKCPETISGAHEWVKHPETGYEYCRACEADKVVQERATGAVITFEVVVRGKVVKVIGHAPPATAAEAVLYAVEEVWGTLRGQLIQALKDAPLPQDWLRY